MARAHAADGEKLAPYETTLADLYLTKAREEQGHAKYADARELAADCIKQADLAARKAVEHRRSPAGAATPEAPLIVPPPSKPVPAADDQPEPGDRRPATAPTETSPADRKPAPAPLERAPAPGEPDQKPSAEPDRKPAAPQPDPGPHE